MVLLMVFWGPEGTWQGVVPSVTSRAGSWHPVDCGLGGVAAVHFRGWADSWTHTAHWAQVSTTLDGRPREPGEWQHVAVWLPWDPPSFSFSRTLSSLYLLRFSAHLYLDRIISYLNPSFFLAVFLLIASPVASMFCSLRSEVVVNFVTEC